MKDETRTWIIFAAENLRSAEVLLKSLLFNPCLQNAQQSVEKACKALLTENNVPIKRTHDIYLPSKYPFGSVLPDFMPDLDFCKHVLEIARRVFADIENQLHH